MTVGISGMPSALNSAIKRARSPQDGSAQASQRGFSVFLTAGRDDAFSAERTPARLGAAAALRSETADGAVNAAYGRAHTYDYSFCKAKASSFRYFRFWLLPYGQNRRLYGRHNRCTGVFLYSSARRASIRSTANRARNANAAPSSAPASTSVG